MKKTPKIIYWVATVWLALGMTSTGIVQAIRMEEEVQKMGQLGYPSYLLIIISVWKFAGVVAILVPRKPVLKEWAYAGFFFLMSGAVMSHFAVGDPAIEFFGPGLLLVLTFVSWYYRPANRTVVYSTIVQPQ